VGRCVHDPESGALAARAPANWRTGPRRTTQATESKRLPVRLRGFGTLGEPDSVPACHTRKGVTRRTGRAAPLFRRTDKKGSPSHNRLSRLIALRFALMVPETRVMNVTTAKHSRPGEIK
jgi:hypothetical protein